MPLSLADVNFSTGRQDAPPESTLGGETTCIVCMAMPKTHIAWPCGHWSACEQCAAKMNECPYCRTARVQWMAVRAV